VWVNLTVYQKDLPYIRVGQEVIISPGYGIPETRNAKGKISYISPVLDEETRTATARVVLPNPEGIWRPGLFVTGKVVIENIYVPILIPKSALQTVEGKTCVFILTEDGFIPQPVETGRSNETHVEIISGLRPGQKYVSKGAFTLKSELSKEEFGGGHGH
jgi:cobalt-zinc-cadmium efflux system membrane fusion protein